MSEKKKKMMEFYCNYAIAKCEKFKEDKSVLSMVEYKKSQGITKREKSGGRRGKKRGGKRNKKRGQNKDGRRQEN